MSSNLTAILDEAQKTAIEASILAANHMLDYWPNPLNEQFNKELVLEVFDKTQGVGNYATIADTVSEKIILKKIQENKVLSSHGFLAEESAGTQSDSPFLWVIDPIDGTLNFKNGLSDFGICIGVLYENKPVLGIIAVPVLKQILVGRKGKGAQLLSFDGKRLANVTNIGYSEVLNKALISYDTGYEYRAKQLANTVEKIADKVGYPVAYSSSSIANYRVALGHVGAYFHLTPTKYDTCAAAAILPEVGGVVTTIKGDDIDWSAEHITYLGARTPEIHKQLLELLNH